MRRSLKSRKKKLKVEKKAGKKATKMALRKEVKKESVKKSQKAVKKVKFIQKPPIQITRKLSKREALFLEMLTKMKENLLQEVAKNIHNETEVTISEIGDLYDQASSDRDRELSLMLGNRDREKLAEIEEALERLNEGTYGICEDCGEEISFGRLKAMPFTRVCINCKAKMEMREKMNKELEEDRTLQGINYSEVEEETET